MNFQRYLAAKRSVDDRALNRRVLDRLADEVATHDSDRLRVVEVGAGVGATVERLLGADWLPDSVEYVAVDLRESNRAVARQRLPERAAAMGYAVRERDDESLVLTRGQRRVVLQFAVDDVFEYLADADADAEALDLVVAQAFADLVDPAKALAAFRDALAPGGLVYLPITFDAETAFETVGEPGSGASGIDPEFENRLLDRFHAHLDEAGESRAGRRLVALASGRDDSELVAVGGSDWVVRPRDGAYPADEAYFLRCVVDMIGGAVRDDDRLDSSRVDNWVERRKTHVSAGELVYVAHQLDLLVR